ncbi:hypothetical protein WDU94_012520 [Cyamophila willieti]
MLEKNVRLLFLVLRARYEAKKWKNIAKGSFYQKMYKNIICSILNSKHFIFLEFSCIFQHYKMAAVAATI